MNIILLGPQGSGKGTQAKLLVQKFGFYYFEMGAFLRDLAETNSTVDRIMNQEGKLVPDDMFFFAMKALLEGKIKGGNSLFLDGFPRTIRQYQTLKNWFEEFNIKVNLVIFINITEDETIRRLSNRRTCRDCNRIWNLVTSPIPPQSDKCECGGKLFQRDDDQPEQIKLRLREYRKNTEPLLDLFKKEGLLFEINGERPILEIQADLVKEIKSRQK